MSKKKSSVIKDFIAVYETGDEWPDYFKCVHCKEKVERGIANISHHWMYCLKRTIKETN